jgi:hypothetical protein
MNLQAPSPPGTIPTIGLSKVPLPPYQISAHSPKRAITLGSKSAPISIKQDCNPGYDSSHVHSINPGGSVQGIALQSGWETFLLAAPLVGMILVGVFRLDQIATNPKSNPGHRTKLAGPSLSSPSLSGIAKNGGTLLSHPNPSPWNNSGGPAVTTSSN